MWGAVQCFRNLLIICKTPRKIVLNIRNFSICAGLLTRKATQKDGDTDSSLAAMRLLFDKAERGGKDVLQMTHLLTSVAAAGADPSDPYGLYQPVSALLIRQAMNPYVPHWMKVRGPPLVASCMRCSPD